MPAGSANAPGLRLRGTALLVALALSSLAHADWRDNYAKAVEAYKAGRLQEAQTLFAQAASEHPEPAERIKLYGLRFEPYVPQHYLGLIAAQSGDCGRARAQWGAAGNADVVSKLGDAASEEKAAAAKCGGTSVAAAPPPPKPPVETNAPAPVTPPAPAPSVASAPPPPRPPVESNRPAPAPPPVVASNKPPEPVNRPPAEAPVDKAAPPEPLLNAFDAFLAGRLNDVARLNPDAFADSRARFHAYLVRSGARFTLGQASGDQALLDGARADARAAKQLNAAAPDAVLFSPRFLAFYRDAR